MSETRRTFSILLVLCAMFAALLAAPHARADDGFLDPADAFRFSAVEKPGEVDVHFVIADGYYMYRERFAFAVKNGKATLGTPILPAGHVKFDDTFQKNVETYRHSVDVRVPVTHADGPFDLVVTGQGCADKGICYPPTEYPVHVSGVALQAQAGAVTGAATGIADTGFSSQDFARRVLEERGVLPALAIFFGLGVALSLLPCSLPMIPILSAIIIGEGAAVTRRRGFLLSLAYVLGMAVVYTIFGVAAGLAGQSLGAWLQNAWVLGAFALLLTIFALSLLGCFEVVLPQAWQSRMDGVAQRQRGGKLAAVFAMGSVSALVVGACMTAPLFGVLAFVAHTGNAVFGGAALFFMALGIGVPLLVIGLGAGTLLPRAGRWMDGVKRALGVILLGAAWWMVVPVLAPWAAMLTAAFCLLVAAMVLGLFEPSALPALASTTALAWRRIGKALGALLALLAVILSVGAAAGSTDLLRPLAVFAGRTGTVATTAELPFGAIHSNAELDRAVASAGRITMLDFYADWCVSCKEMEKLTFTDPRVRDIMSRFNRLRADVTANNADDRALLKRFGLFGPPGILFFDAQGHELPALRVVGYQDAATFLKTLTVAAAAPH